MRLFLSGLLVLIWATAAAAADNLQFGPPPHWVIPVTLPAAGKSTQAAIKYLLVDQQIQLTPDTVTTYVEYTVRIQTPEGLSKAGTVTIVWNPDTDAVTVNQIEILRAGKTINVLKSGQTFTVARRETNLDYAALDDTLTGILEPADLEVGDTLEVAYTLTSTDPILAGTPETEAAISPAIPISKVHISAIWPATKSIHWQATKELKGIQTAHTGNTSGINLTLTNLQPAVQPDGAPLRYYINPHIDFSGFSSWAQVAHRLYPLYQHAAELGKDSPLLAEIAHIRAANPDPKRQAAMALALVESKVRYVLLAMHGGAENPAPADLTWSRRFGDCKAKTALLLALLHGLGIQAEPVLVSMFNGGGLDTRLPMLGDFDHVLVRAVIGGQTYWLDGTRLGDTRIDRLHEPFYHWGLPLVAKNARLLRVLPPPLTQPQTQTVIHIDATAGVAQPESVDAQAEVYGEVGYLMNMQFGNMEATQREQALRSYWTSQPIDAHIKSVSASYDKNNGVERLTMQGTMTMGWNSGTYTLGELAIGSESTFKRGTGQDQRVPYVVPYPYFTRTTEIIQLPLNGEGFSVIGPDVKRTIAGSEYQRHADINGETLTATASVRSVAPEFPASQLKADEQALHDLADAGVEVQAPAGHQPTPNEIAWGLPKSNSGAADFVTSGNDLLSRGLYFDAREDFNAALAFNARDQWALADRGLTYAWQGNNTLANKDLKAALAINPRNWAAFNGLGLLAHNVGDDTAAIAAFTEAIQINPKDAFAIYQRAVAYWSSGKNQAALTDLDTVIKLNPKSISSYWIRTLILKQEGKLTEGIRQARLIMASNPKNTAAYFTAAAIYDQFGKLVLANAALSHTLPTPPTAESYLSLATARPRTDIKGRRADIESALKLDPTSTAALSMLAVVQMDRHEFSAAVRSLTLALDKSPDDSSILTLRASAYEKSGQNALASADLAKARSVAKDSGAANDMCWELATTDTFLTTALNDCDAALAQSPRDAATLDSRGLVLLRLARYKDAISAYNAALGVDPWTPTSLYGRGICELRTGKTTAGHADIRMALALSYNVANEFAHFGIRP